MEDSILVKEVVLEKMKEKQKEQDQKENGWTI